MPEYTEVHYHDSAADTATGISAAMVMLILGGIVALLIGLFWWQPWAPSAPSNTTIVQPAPNAPDTIIQPPDTNVIVPPAQNSEAPRNEINVNTEDNTTSTIPEPTSGGAGAATTGQ